MAMQFRRATIFAACIAAAAAFPAWAEPDTLESAFRDAISSSPDLAARRARVDSVRANVAIVYSERQPQLSATVTAARWDRDDPARRFTGTEIREEWRAGGQASQLVFDSGRVGASGRQARAQLRSSEAAYREAYQSVLLQTVEAYANVRQARAATEARRANLKNLQDQKAYVAANQRAGFLTLTDVAQADARIAAAESQLARAISEEIAAHRAFMRFVGRPPGGELEAPAAPDGLPEVLDTALDTAGRQRASLEAARQQERAADAAVDAAHAAGRPRVSLEANTFMDNGFEFEDDDRFVEDYVGLRLTVPIWSGGANRARARQQRAIRAASRFDLAVAHREVERGVATAIADLSATRAAERAAKTQVEAAELALKGIRREQQSGLRSVVDVLNQEQELLEARLALARAERDRIVAERALQFETGTLECESCTGRPS